MGSMGSHFHGTAGYLKTMDFHEITQLSIIISPKMTATVRPACHALGVVSGRSQPRVLPPYFAMRMPRASERRNIYHLGGIDVQRWIVCCDFFSFIGKYMETQIIQLCSQGSTLAFFQHGSTSHPNSQHVSIARSMTLIGEQLHCRMP